MHDKEAIEMMRRCMSEIKILRAEIDRLAPRAKAYDDISILLGLFPRPGISMSEDLAWVLDKRIREIEKAAAETASAKEG